MEEELKKMYDSEINVRIQCFWDGGWRVAVGDGLNGLNERYGNTYSAHFTRPGLLFYWNDTDGKSIP